MKMFELRLKFDPYGNKSPLVQIRKSMTTSMKYDSTKYLVLFQIMSWHRAGDKPISESTMDYFDDTYVRHLS